MDSSADETDYRAISEFTRRDLIDFLVLEKVDRAGRIEEHDFLARMFDLHNMPSTESQER